MLQLSLRCRLSSFTAVVGFITFVLAGCASDAMNTPIIPSPPPDPKETAAASAKIPTNYRSIVAEYIRTHNEYVIHNARITPPYLRFGMSAVCVAIYRNNPLGVLVRDNRVFTFDNGQIREIRIGMVRVIAHSRILGRPRCQRR